MDMYDATAPALTSDAPSISDAPEAFSIPLVPAVFYAARLIMEQILSLNLQQNGLVVMEQA